MLSEILIQETFERGAAAWPDVEVSREQLAVMMKELDVSEADLRAWARDFYLACAAGCGDLAAIAIIDAQLIRRLSRRIQRLGASSDDLADIFQAVRERL